MQDIIDEVLEHFLNSLIRRVTLVQILGYLAHVVEGRLLILPLIDLRPDRITRC